MPAVITLLDTYTSIDQVIPICGFPIHLKLSAIAKPRKALPSPSQEDPNTLLSHQSIIQRTFTTRQLSMHARPTTTTGLIRLREQRTQPVSETSTPQHEPCIPEQKNCGPHDLVAPVYQRRRWCRVWEEEACGRFDERGEDVDERVYCEAEDEFKQELG